MRTKAALGANERRLRSPRRTYAQEGVPEGQDDVQKGRRSGPPPATPPEGQPVAGTGIVEARPRVRSARIDWARVDWLLGTMSDADLARRLGCSPDAVWRRRHRLGVVVPRLRERIVSHLRQHGPRQIVDIALALRTPEPNIAEAIRALCTLGAVAKDGPHRSRAPWRLVGAP